MNRHACMPMGTKSILNPSIPFETILKIVEDSQNPVETIKKISQLSREGRTVALRLKQYYIERKYPQQARLATLALQQIQQAAPQVQINVETIFEVMTSYTRSNANT